MKKLILSSLFLFSFLLISCTEKGEIKIINSTNNDLLVKIESTESTINSGESYSKGWELSNSIFSTEDKTITMESAGIFKFYFKDEYTVKPGKTTRINVQADAGAVRIMNYSTALNIVDIYLSPSNDQYWGNDMLSSTLSPGYWVAYRVESGSWDVKVVDHNGVEYFAYDQYVSIDQFADMNFNPGGANIFGAINKKQDGANMSVPSLKKEFFDMGIQN